MIRAKYYFKGWGHLLFLLILLIIGIWDLYYLDYQIYNNYFLTGLKYLHVPTLTIAFLWSSSFLKVIIHDNTIDRKTRIISTLGTWFMLYLLSGGYISIANRTLGEQQETTLSGKILEIEKERVFTHLSVYVQTAEGSDYLMVPYVPYRDRNLFSINDTFSLKMKKGSLGLKYIE